MPLLPLMMPSPPPITAETAEGAAKTAEGAANTAESCR